MLNPSDELAYKDTPRSFSQKRRRGILPQEVVNMIISYIYDIETLCSCSETCRSWYNAAVHRLHYSLKADTTRNKWCTYRWPEPLQKLSEFGLLPLVNRLCIETSGLVNFTPEHLYRPNGKYFSQLTSLRELRIDNFQLSCFMENPTLRYFGCISPTLESLALISPSASRREILDFIGFFPNLQDLKIRSFKTIKEDRTTEELLPDPPTIPPLRGRLTLILCEGEKLVKDMIARYQELRFRHMELMWVDCAELLLNACAKTLETLHLHGWTCGEDFFGLTKRG